MSDNFLELKLLQSQVILAEMAEKTKSCALEWQQFAPAVFKSEWELDGDLYDAYLAKLQNHYVLDFLEDDEIVLSIHSAVNEDLGTLYVMVERLFYANPFVEPLIGLQKQASCKRLHVEEGNGGVVIGGKGVRSHDLTASGGLVLGGSADVIALLPGHGGVKAGGTSIHNMIMFNTGRGGVTIRGDRSSSYFMTGGIVVSGSATPQVLMKGTGGVVVGGAAHLFGGQMFVTGSGGVVVGGVAPAEHLFGLDDRLWINGSIRRFTTTGTNPQTFLSGQPCSYDVDAVNQHVYYGALHPSGLIWDFRKTNLELQSIQGFTAQEEPFTGNMKFDRWNNFIWYGRSSRYWTRSGLVFYDSQLNNGPLASPLDIAVFSDFVYTLDRVLIFNELGQAVESSAFWLARHTKAGGFVNKRTFEFELFNPTCISADVVGDVLYMGGRYYPDGFSLPSWSAIAKVNKNLVDGFEILYQINPNSRVTGIVVEPSGRRIGYCFTEINFSSKRLYRFNLTPTGSNDLTLRATMGGILGNYQMMKMDLRTTVPLW